MELGLLFTCRLGNVDLDRPVGLLQKKEEQGAQTTMEATLMAQQSPQQREQVPPPPFHPHLCFSSPQWFLGNACPVRVVEPASGSLNGFLCKGGNQHPSAGGHLAGAPKLRLLTFSN